MDDMARSHLLSSKPLRTSVSIFLTAESPTSLVSLLVSNVIITSPPGGKRSIAMMMYVFVRLFVRLPAYLRNQTTEIYQFFAHFFLVMARSSSDGVVICYVLPVLWMTSCLKLTPRVGGRDERLHV